MPDNQYRVSDEHSVSQENRRYLFTEWESCSTPRKMSPFTEAPSIFCLGTLAKCHVLLHPLPVMELQIGEAKNRMGNPEKYTIPFPPKQNGIDFHGRAIAQSALNPNCLGPRGFLNSYSHLA